MISQFAVMKQFCTVWSKGRQKRARPEEEQHYLEGGKRG